MIHLKKIEVEFQPEATPQLRPSEMEHTFPVGISWNLGAEYGGARTNNLVRGRQLASSIRHHVLYRSSLVWKAQSFPLRPMVKDFEIQAN